MSFDSFGRLSGGDGGGHQGYGSLGPAPVQPVRVCSNCRVGNAPGNQFCEQCGKRLDTSSAIQPIRRDQAAEPGNPSVRSDSRQGLQMLRPISWIAVVVGLTVWSLSAWIGYVTVDGVLGWVEANAGLAVDKGKDFATAVGVGKDGVGAIDRLNLGSLTSQAIALLRVVAKPAIVVLWAIGAVVLVSAPAIQSRIAGLFAPHRH
ncbi:hypothetical protein [Tardiphaga sp.]|uniref:hypothetical protein n=1 Tax=Tardiphaga sp. TaxID=1926292 RepID=UPI00352A5EA6